MYCHQSFLPEEQGKHNQRAPVPQADELALAKCSGAEPDLRAGPAERPAIEILREKYGDPPALTGELTAEEQTAIGPYAALCYGISKRLGHWYATSIAQNQTLNNALTLRSFERDPEWVVSRITRLSVDDQTRQRVLLQALQSDRADALLRLMLDRGCTFPPALAAKLVEHGHQAVLLANLSAFGIADGEVAEQLAIEVIRNQGAAALEKALSCPLGLTPRVAKELAERREYGVIASNINKFECLGGEEIDRLAQKISAAGDLHALGLLLSQGIKVPMAIATETANRGSGAIVADNWRGFAATTTSDFNALALIAARAGNLQAVSDLFNTGAPLSKQIYEELSAVQQFGFLYERLEEFRAVVPDILSDLAVGAARSGNGYLLGKIAEQTTDRLPATVALGCIESGMTSLLSHSIDKFAVVGSALEQQILAKLLSANEFQAADHLIQIGARPGSEIYQQLLAAKQHPFVVRNRIAFGINTSEQLTSFLISVVEQGNSYLAPEIIEQCAEPLGAAAALALVKAGQARAVENYADRFTIAGSPEEQEILAGLFSANEFSVASRLLSGTVRAGAEIYQQLITAGQQVFVYKHREAFGIDNSQKLTNFLISVINSGAIFLAREIIEECQEPLGPEAALVLIETGNNTLLQYRAARFAIPGSPLEQDILKRVFGEQNFGLAGALIEAGARPNLEIRQQLIEAGGHRLVYRFKEAFGITDSAALTELGLSALRAKDTQLATELVENSTTPLLPELAIALVNGGYHGTVMYSLSRFAIADSPLENELFGKLFTANRSLGPTVRDWQLREKVNLSARTAELFLLGDYYDKQHVLKNSMHFKAPTAEEAPGLISAFSNFVAAAPSFNILKEVDSVETPLFKAVEPYFHFRTVAQIFTDHPEMFATKEFDPELLQLQLFRQFRRYADPLRSAAMVEGFEQMLNELISSSSIDGNLLVRMDSHEVLQYLFYNTIASDIRASGNRCGDRSDHLAALRFAQRYSLAFYADETVIRKSNAPALGDEIGRAVAELVSAADHAPSKKLPVVELEGSRYRKIGAKASPEGRLALCLLDTLRGDIPEATLRDLMLRWYFSEPGEGRSFVERFREIATKPQSATFHQLSALHDFYRCELPRVVKSIVEKAMLCPEIQQELAHLYRDATLSAERREAAAQGSRLNTVKVISGATLLQQIEGILDRGNEIESRLADMSPIIKQFPGNPGLRKSLQGVLNSEITPEKKEAALRAIIKNTRVKLSALEKTEGEDLAQADSPGLAALQKLGPCPKSFAAFCRQELNQLFEEARSGLAREIKNWDLERRELQPIDLEAYFSKNLTAAFAPTVAGVCIAGENATWDNPCHFTLVLRDPETKRCQGAVLLFLYVDGGKKILVPCLNPSSTYLTKVDGEKLFHALRNLLIDFAKENEIDEIALPADSNIRSNRSGTPFAHAMDKELVERNDLFSLSVPHPISLERGYCIKELYRLWSREGETQGDYGIGS